MPLAERDPPRHSFCRPIPRPRAKLVLAVVCTRTAVAELSFAVAFFCSRWKEEIWWKVFRTFAEYGLLLFLL